LVCKSLIHRGFIGGWHDGARNLRDKEHSLEEKEAHKGKRKPWTLREFGGKTVWDWMGLLIVPIVLSLITVVFAWQQDVRQQEIEDRRAQEAQKIEGQRAEAERELAEQRAQDEALQAYLDQMSSLLLERDLRESEEDSEVRTLARARTLTVLERMDPSRKRAVIQFLYEADLVLRNEGSQPITKPIISLEGADLEGADLRAAVMWFADLSGADLSGAILHDAELPGATLKETDLSKADLSDAFLYMANLPRANLSEADLEGADLRAADLRKADLSDAPT
jgi:uncharacterized protein YjbI with pentapeptide repeats